MYVYVTAIYSRASTREQKRMRRERAPRAQKGEGIGNAMCVQRKWPSANINNRRGKYTVRSERRLAQREREREARTAISSPRRGAKGTDARGDSSRSIRDKSEKKFTYTKYLKIKFKLFKINIFLYLFIILFNLKCFFFLLQ